MTAVLGALGLALLAAAVLALELGSERRNHARTRAALARERATTEAARVLYGEARMREAARVVELRERSRDYGHRA